VKKASPSKGVLRAQFDPAAIARSYAAHGAACLSVLTDVQFFQGAPEYLQLAREASGLPVLRKDFMIDEYQIWEARAHGADLILLIVASLSDAQLREYTALSRELGMNVLVETHTAEEIERAVAAEARIIGVNVRNLKTLDVDRSVFAELAGGIPAGALVIAESGVRGVDDVRHYAANGANAVLVGEALVSDATPRERIAEFMAAGAEEIAARS
jgi:indole-3-glycerol phosphate synthase